MSDSAALIYTLGVDKLNHRNTDRKKLLTTHFIKSGLFLPAVGFIF